MIRKNAIYLLGPKNLFMNVFEFIKFLPADILTRKMFIIIAQVIYKSMFTLLVAD